MCQSSEIIGEASSSVRGHYCFTLTRPDPPFPALFELDRDERGNDARQHMGGRTVQIVMSSEGIFDRTYLNWRVVRDLQAGEEWAETIPECILTSVLFSIVYRDSLKLLFSLWRVRPWPSTLIPIRFKVGRLRRVVTDGPVAHMHRWVLS
jgi:hypothetical protein